MPFEAVPQALPKSTSREERLNRSLAILDKQHDAVRRNMMCIALSQKERIIEDARRVLQEDGFDGSHVMSNVRAVSDAEEEAIIKRMRNPARKNAKPGHYEYKGGSTVTEGRQIGQTCVDMDTADIEDESRARAIHLEAADRVRTLVTGTASNLEGYDTIAKETKDVYLKALDRERTRAKSTDGKGRSEIEDAATVEGVQDLPTVVPRSRTSVDKSRDPRLI